MYGIRFASAIVVLLAGLVCTALAQENAPPADVQKEIASLIESMAKDDFAGKDATEKLVKIGKPAVEPLLEALKSAKPRVRYWSAAAVARIGDERGYLPLVELVKSDPVSLVRSTALYYLQHYPRQEVWDLAIRMLDDPDAGVREWAVKLLAATGRKEAAPKIRELTKHPDQKMRLVAMEGLVNLVETDAIETLRTVVKTDKDPVVREGALRCLVILKEKPPVILTVMIDAMEDPDVDVRAFAATLLLKGTTQVFPFEPGGDSTARAATVAAWREWYEKNKDRLFWNAGKRRFEVKDEKGK